MRIDVKMQKVTKPADKIEVFLNLKSDLRSCMQCRFFYGNNHQCIKSKCVKEDLKSVKIQDKEDICFECPYKQSEYYCFPCMKKVLGVGMDRQEKEKEQNG